MYSVEIVNTGTSTFRAVSKDSEFILDTKGNGFAPPDALLASLGSCIGVYIRKYIDGAKLELKGFTLKLEAMISEEKPSSFRQISVSIDLQDANMDERRKKALLSFIRNCPVHNTLKVTPAIGITIS